MNCMKNGLPRRSYDCSAITPFTGLVQAAAPALGAPQLQVPHSAELRIRLSAAGVVLDPKERAKRPSRSHAYLAWLPHPHRRRNLREYPVLQCKQLTEKYLSHIGERPQGRHATTAH